MEIGAGTVHHCILPKKKVVHTHTRICVR